MDALKMELGKVNKVLDEAKLKLLQVGEMEKAFVKVNGRVKELETQVDWQKGEIYGLKIEVSTVKETIIAQFIESDAYKEELTHTVTLFMAKERIKTQKVL